MKKIINFFKKRNWNLISNVAVIGALITVVIGMYVVVNNLTAYEKRLQRLELNYSLLEDDCEEIKEINSKNKIKEEIKNFFNEKVE